jgi:hypothetical protein
MTEDKACNPFAERVFIPGQVVVATCNYGHRITEGKQYRVLDYANPVPTPNFWWPAYVTVDDDFGGKTTGHTHRFRALKEGEEVTLPPLT